MLDKEITHTNTIGNDESACLCQSNITCHFIFRAHTSIARRKVETRASATIGLLKDKTHNTTHTAQGSGESLL